MERQRGIIQLYVLAGIAVIGLLFFGNYKYMELQNRELVMQAKDNKNTIEVLKTKNRVRDIIDTANKEALNILSVAQVESENNRQKRVNKANSLAIQNTLNERSEKYAGFIERVGKKNVEIIECRTDYRRMRDEKACIGHIR